MFTFRLAALQTSCANWNCIERLFVRLTKAAGHAHAWATYGKINPVEIGATTASKKIQPGRTDRLGRPLIGSEVQKRYAGLRDQINREAQANRAPAR